MVSSLVVDKANVSTDNLPAYTFNHVLSIPIDTGVSVGIV